MSLFVVDASVAVKWMLPEPLSNEAVRLGGQMVTADERFVNSLASTPWAASAIRLQDVP